ncbi:MAG: right-handed parallel beta-helix repeat-containing protein [Verrucomicrobia bacterium]|nr:right-handed parallel beta-helix repeat-containing protein [Verrucomicrobiota bacterium]
MNHHPVFFRPGPVMPCAWILMTAMGGIFLFGKDSTPSGGSLADLKGPRVDLRKCGALGDGKSNDTAAFQQAAEQIEGAGGGVLSIPKGIYMVGLQTHEDGEFPYDKAQPIFSVKNVNGLSIEGHGATIRIAPGLRYGSFDKETGKPINPTMPFTDPDCRNHIGSMFDIQGSVNVLIRDLDLDGNLAQHILGGEFGDRGRQLTANGILLYNNSNVTVANVHTHHHALDGIIIGWTGLKESDPPTPHTLVQVTSEYNGRQGLSWVGGRGLTVRHCKFNHNGRGGINTPPAAGLDIEAEESVGRDGLFEDCEFVNNTGCGMVVDTGDAGYTRFVRCTFWGTTAWSTWVTKPGIKFEGCSFHGSTVWGYGSTNAALATRYENCRFEDLEYGTNGVYRAEALVKYEPSPDREGGENIAYDGCEFVAHKIRALIFTPGKRTIFRNCKVKHGWAEAPDGTAQSMFLGGLLEKVHFSEDFPTDLAKQFFIKATGVTVGEGVIVDGPGCLWGTPDSSDVGAIPTGKTSP